VRCFFGYTFKEKSAYRGGVSNNMASRGKKAKKDLTEELETSTTKNWFDGRGCRPPHQ